MWPHWLERCRGPEVAPREYLPPRGCNFTGFMNDEIMLLLNGHTIFKHRCDKCGRKFINKREGDWREQDV